MRVLGLARSDRQRDLPDQTGQNEQSAQAMAVALVRQKEAAEADPCGEGHGFDQQRSCFVSPALSAHDSRQRRSLSKLA